MKVSWKIIKKKYRDLILENSSREEISEWAYSLMQKDDIQELEYLPFQDKEKIQKGFIFLTSADLMISPEEYFHKLSVYQEFISNLE